MAPACRVERARVETSAGLYWLDQARDGFATPTSRAEAIASAEQALRAALAALTGEEHEG